MRKQRSGEEKKLLIKDETGDHIDCGSPAANLHKKRKSVISDQTDPSAGRGTKKSRRQVKAMDQITNPVDLISQLPTHLTHHILSFLRCKKDAARTSTLSKRWRDTWASYSSLEFDQRKFQKQLKKVHHHSKKQYLKIQRKTIGERFRKNEMFRAFVENALQTRSEQKTSIEKFRLHLTYFSLELSDHIDRWIDFAATCNMKELDLFIPSKNIKRYHLPQIVFAASTLTALRISGCELKILTDVNLFNLQKLCFSKLHIDEQIIQHLMLSCPLIDDLRLIFCTGLKTLLLSSDKLERVDVHFCYGLKNVEVLSPYLQSFWYHGNKSQRCKINLAMCKDLKRLHLEDANMKDDRFQTLLSNFTVIEQLSLSKCNSLKHITISSHRLKSLALRECSWLAETDIDTPNLLSFEYKGQHMPFSSLNPTLLVEAKLHFETPVFRLGDDSKLWFYKLLSFLGKFDRSKGLKLIVCSGKNVIIHEDLREMLVPEHFELKLEIVKSSTSLDSLLDNLLRAWPPETLSVVSSTTSEFPEQLHWKMADKEKEPSCCSYNSVNNKCWKHFLKDISIENLRDTEKKSDWTNWLKSSAPLVNKMTCFRLNWKRRQE
ncbi:uncharacterized protein LOC126682106 [Mercurialis annua]|uniref:uncharacterized protein LOC126682106 n=1 Tax=Mercurialis annua TaxID=3986 RepID=UPI0021600189|nr:uncharacterized protein LOC126682106 [Mercurialis annua]XP_050233625.1 uncharacterized protein LOC126682106 [Mercurialis annua]